MLKASPTSKTFSSNEALEEVIALHRNLHCISPCGTVGGRVERGTGKTNDEAGDDNENNDQTTTTPTKKKKSENKRKGSANYPKLGENDLKTIQKRSKDYSKMTRIRKRQCPKNKFCPFHRRCCKKEKNCHGRQLRRFCGHPQ